MATRKSSFGADATVIEVQQVNDKAELLAIPFIIREAWLHMNASGVEFLYLTCETENDGFKVVSDSSTTGVKTQVLALLPNDFTVESEKLTGLSLFAPKGLRKSSYEVRDSRGKAKSATTYYVA